MRFSILCAGHHGRGNLGNAGSRDDPSPSPGGNWLGRWFSFGKQANKNDLEPSSLQPTVPPAGNRRNQAEDDFHRRSEVCLELERIANRTNDEKLLVQVEQLKLQIWQHYVKMTNVSDR